MGYYFDHSIINHVSQLVVEQMSIRGILSLTMYHVGDHVHDMIERNNINQAWVHYLYQRVMCISSKLDTQNEVWKTVQE